VQAEGLGKWKRCWSKSKAGPERDPGGGGAERPGAKMEGRSENGQTSSALRGKKRGVELQLKGEVILKLQMQTRKDLLRQVRKSAGKKDAEREKRRQGRETKLSRNERNRAGEGTQQKKIPAV